MPTAFGGDADWIDGVITKVEARIVAQGLYPADAVFVYLGRPADLLQNPPRDAFCVLTPATLTPDLPLLAGGGADVLQYDARVTVAQYQRLWRDQQFRDAKRLKDASLGLAQSVRRLVKAMLLWEAAAGDEDSPLIEPARPVGDVRFNPRDAPLGWGAVESTWELKFRADLS